MSRSNRRPAGTPSADPAEDLLPEIAYPWLVSMRAVPEKTRNGMRTVDPVHRGGPPPEKTESLVLVARASVVVEQLELAATEAADEAIGTRLHFLETRNDATGKWGIIVRELLSPRHYSRPLAELLGTGGELTDEAKDQANWLGWSAANQQLASIRK